MTKEMNVPKKLTRAQVKSYFVQAAEVGNFEMAKLMMSYLGEFITKEGFVDSDEVYEYYTVQRWLEQHIA